MIFSHFYANFKGLGVPPLGYAEAGSRVAGVTVGAENFLPLPRGFAARPYTRSRGALRAPSSAPKILEIKISHNKSTPRGARGSAKHDEARGLAMRRAGEARTEGSVAAEGMSDSDREAATKCTRSVAAAASAKREPTQPPKP